MRKKGDSPHIDRERRRALIRGAVLRPTLTVIAFGCAYFFLPWIDVHTASAIFLLIGGGAAVLAVTTWQVWRILRSDVPSLQAVEAVAVVMPTYLLLVSITYFSVEHASLAVSPNRCRVWRRCTFRCPSSRQSDSVTSPRRRTLPGGS